MTEQEQSLALLSHYRFEGDLDGDVAKVICPFHDDTTPSLCIYLRKADAHCYACGWHGTLLDMVAQLEKVRHLQALMLLSKWAKADDVQQLGRIMAGRHDPKPKFDAAKSRERVLPRLTDSESRAEYYMYRRGFTMETLNHFDLRYDERSEWPVVIPIRTNDKCVAWQRRALDDRRNKYKFISGVQMSSLVAGQTTGRVLVMTEGYFDLMMCWQHIQHIGWNYGVCSPLTWLLRERQAEQIDAALVVVALDNDERGREGTERVMRLLPNAVSIPWECAYKDIGEMDSATFGREVRLAIKQRKVA